MMKRIDQILRRYWLALVFLVVCVGCAVGYHLTEAHIDAEGVLHEPFALVFLSYLFGLLSFVTAVLVTGKVLWYRSGS